MRAFSFQIRSFPSDQTNHKAPMGNMRFLNLPYCRIIGDAVATPPQEGLLRRINLR